MFRLYRRGEVWWVRLNGERRSTKCKDRKAAESVAAEWERASVDPSYRAAHTATLLRAAELYLEDLKRRGRSASTLEVAEQKSRHLLRLLPEKLAHVDAAAVDAYVAARESEGASPLTVTKELSALRQTLKLAGRRGEYARLVEHVMPVGYSPEYEPRKRWLPRDELVKLLAALPPKRAAHVAFIVATSARWSESLRAERADIDLAAGTVLVRGSKTKKSWRTVPIVPLFRDLLERALRDAPGATVLFEPWKNVRRDLWSACTGELPRKPNQPAVVVKKDPAGIEPCTPNDLRRTTGKWLRRAGVEPHLIAAMLGHTTTRMVEMVYGTMDADALGELIVAKVGAGSVPPVYRHSSRKGTEGSTDMAKTQEISSRLGDLNPRPAVYETGPQAYESSLKQALSTLEASGLVPSAYSRARAMLLALLQDVERSTGRKAGAS